MEVEQDQIPNLWPVLVQLGAQIDIDGNLVYAKR